MTRYIYTAGSMTGLTYKEAGAWREMVEKELPPPKFKCLSPMRNTELHHKKMRRIPQKFDNEYVIEKAIFYRDTFDISRCDLMFVNLLGAKRVSIGTVAEMGIAYSKNIPIVLIMEKNNCHNHPFVNTMAHFRTPFLKKGIALVKDILLP